MTSAELAKATKQFDKPLRLEDTRPLSAANRARWERARRQPSRSVYVMDSDGKGAEPVLIELDGDLLKRADAYARSRQMTRAELIDRSLRSTLSFVDTPKKQRPRKSA